MYFVFDVESVGLYGIAFAFGYVVIKNGNIINEGCYSIPLENIICEDLDDLYWIKTNIPTLPITHRSSLALRNKFWEIWTQTKDAYPDITMWADCCFPVETNFLSSCVQIDPKNRKWEGPYPLLDISTLLLSKGKNPKDNFPRLEKELLAHNPLCDARQSARILIENI